MTTCNKRSQSTASYAETTAFLDPTFPFFFLFTQKAGVNKKEKVTLSRDEASRGNSAKRNPSALASVLFSFPAGRTASGPGASLPAPKSSPRAALFYLAPVPGELASISESRESTLPKDGEKETARHFLKQFRGGSNRIFCPLLLNKKKREREKKKGKLQKKSMSG